MFNGTGGNVTALSAVLRPFEAVICPETAHINVDECGAPERIAGAKLVDVPTADAQADAGAAGLPAHRFRRPASRAGQGRVDLAVDRAGHGVHAARISGLARTAHEAGLLLQVDGARLVNAAEALGLELRELTSDCGSMC